MSLAADQEYYNFRQALAIFARDVTLRQVRTLTGPGATQNPPTIVGPLALVGAITAGISTTLTLGATSLTGRLAAGDVFFLASDGAPYTAASDVVAANNRFTNIPLLVTPVGVSHPDGTVVWNTEFAADTTLRATVQGYSQFLINGTAIRQGDRRVTFMSDQVGDPPTDIDRIIIDGKALSIIQVRAMQIAGAIVAYSCQVRD